MAEAGELRAAVEEWDESEDEDDDIVCIFGSFRQTAQESFEAKKRPKRGGSVPGKAPNKRRDFQPRYHRMIEQYFAADPVYNARDFRCRFRMSKRLFLRVLDGVLETDRYFEQRPDCKGDLGIHPLMKVTAALRVLAYADSADALDENLEMTDGIYPDWPVFIKPLHQPLGNKQKYFTKRQEACRKDVERAFGVLQARWRILALPCRLLSRLDMNKVMRACIILHNMVVEDNREELGDVHEYLFDEHAVMGPSPEFIVSRPHGLRPRSVRELSEHIVSIENTEAHFKIRDDIIDHLWLYHAGETHC
ncbi:hypothetical protein PF003_g6415 [Phytophthora fragariae]|nr:hypothetical protein PF003_g6415 [Phytophthora fragariae]